MYRLSISRVFVFCFFFVLFCFLFCFCFFFFFFCFVLFCFLVFCFCRFSLLVWCFFFLIFYLTKHFLNSLKISGTFLIGVWKLIKNVIFGALFLLSNMCSNVQSHLIGKSMLHSSPRCPTFDFVFATFVL